MINRRKFGIAASSAVLGADALFLSQQAFAQTAAAGSGVARMVGMEMCKGALGKAGGEAFATALNFAGLGDGGLGQVSAKLDQIIASIKELQDTVNAFRRETEIALRQMSYDNNFSPLLKLIETNSTLVQLYSDWIADGAKVKSPYIGTINKFYNASYLNGIETWNDVLLGVAGKTGLLKAWGAAVLSRSKPYYGPVEPKGGGPRMVQAQWDYFDAQQALTANFLITYLRGTGEVPTANAMHKRWMQNRTAQIRSLRGGVLAVDRFPEKTEGVLVYYLVTQLNALPNEVILHATRGGAWLMWYRRAGDAIPQGTGIDGRPMDIQRNLASAVKDTGVREGWRLPSYAEFADLINNVLGGTRLGDGTSEKFAGNLQALGFTGLNRTPTIWFERDSKNRTVVQTENRPWFVGTHDANPNFMGHTLLVRDVSSAQAQRFVWSD
jgi:hypothetical protein